MIDNQCAPNGISIGAKSIGKVELQSKFDFIQQDSEKISVCVCFRVIYLRPETPYSDGLATKNQSRRDG